MFNAMTMCLVGTDLEGIHFWGHIIVGIRTGAVNNNCRGNSGVNILVSPPFWAAGGTQGDGVHAMVFVADVVGFPSLVATVFQESSSWRVEQSKQIYLVPSITKYCYPTCECACDDVTHVTRGPHCLCAVRDVNIAEPKNF